MCFLCAAVRPFDPDCPYTGTAASQAVIGQPESDPTGFGPGRDIPGGPQTTVVLAPGMRLNAEIGFAGDTDWFRISLVEDQAYEVSLSALPFGGLGDPKLFLFDASGQLLTSNDNKFGSLDSLLAFTASRTGDYFVGATGFGGDGSTTGAYQIALNAVDYDGDTVGDIPALAVPITVNAPVTGTIDFVDDFDMYSIRLEAGKSYYVELLTRGADGRPLGDPMIQVLDGGLRVIAENDDNGVGRDSFIAFDVPETGTYYIQAAGARSSTGDFRLRVMELLQPADYDPLKGIEWGSSLDSTTVTYFFAGPGEEAMGEITDSAWTAYEKAQAAAALQEYSKIAPLSFSEVSSRAQADFVLGKGFLDSGLSGKMGPPDPAMGEVRGQGWFNTNPTFWSDRAGGLLEPGAYGYANFIHEFGHGIGLAHPHDDGGGTGQLFRGVLDASDIGYLGLNQEVFTIMSYNKGWQAGPTGPNDAMTYGMSMTPMAFDIALIQRKYGANMAWAAGDDSYTLVATNAPGTGYVSIWDAGGRDVIRHDGSAPAVIDLRVANLQAAEGGGGYVSYVKGVFGGFTIANGVVIETAVGGGGDDALTGNAVANLLRGRDGNDRLDGLGGNDTLHGGDGADTLVGGAGHDLIRGGDTGADLRDVAFGGDGNDTIYGGAGNDELHGGSGDDFIFGEVGADTLIGNAGRDTLAGGALSDVVFGGAGDDFINGGFGFDRLNGGDGADTFFHQGVAGHGSDWIQDFSALAGDLLSVGLAAATRAQFQVNLAATAGAGAAGVDEAFVIYRPTGQILFALVDGGGQASINLQIGGQVYDLLV
jgi:Ca2+-binding RTX toxin-like protein